jgi:hypothetical protein
MPMDQTWQGFCNPCLIASFSFGSTGFKLRASSLLGRCSTSWATPTAHLPWCILGTLSKHPDSNAAAYLHHVDVTTEQPWQAASASITIYRGGLWTREPPAVPCRAGVKLRQPESWALPYLADLTSSECASLSVGGGTELAYCDGCNGEKGWLWTRSWRSLEGVVTLWGRTDLGWEQSGVTLWMRKEPIFFVFFFPSTGG